ncbi:MAG: hypothetical protein NWE99_00555 [Candidatus Bathyarchaeota archaeon]|nr:hypothetical protein [Candidatus Bathyarchaeota archaeon]
MENAKEKIGWKAHWRIDKFHDAENKIAGALQAGLSMFDAQQMFRDAYRGCEEFEANIALNEGLQELIDIICGLGTPTKWDNANARLGVGNSNTAESASQTGLQGASKTFKAMDTGYPQRSGQTAEWRATFGSADANYAWEEYTVVNAADDTGKNLNRKVASKGTKSSGETWTLSLQVSFS